MPYCDGDSHNWVVAEIGSVHMTQKVHALDYFPAGVAPFQGFKSNIDELDKIVMETEDDEWDGCIMLNPRVEIAFIGLLAYFEAFCKGQFASVVNISPSLLRSLGKMRGPVSIPLDDLYVYIDYQQPKIGFLIAEQYDFGSSSKVNSLFRDLIGITPFSKVEATRFDKLLHDRNLLVHHGGIYTLQYAKQRLPVDQLKEFAFRDSLLLIKQDYLDASKFLSSIVMKTSFASYNKLEEMFRGRETELSQEQYAAIGYMKSWEEEL